MSQRGLETAALRLVAEVGQRTAAMPTAGAFALPLRAPAPRERESADRFPALRLSPIALVSPWFGPAPASAAALAAGPPGAEVVQRQVRVGVDVGAIEPPGVGGDAVQHRALVGAQDAAAVVREGLPRQGRREHKRTYGDQGRAPPDTPAGAEDAAAYAYDVPPN